MGKKSDKKDDNMGRSLTSLIENYKVAVCGGGGVGKSCITIQFVQNQFIETWDPTIEDSYNKQIKIDNHNIMLNILDTAGQEEYRALRDEYMRAGDGFLLVFDVGNEKTFAELEQFRVQIQRSKDCDNPPMIVVGNKCDLPPERRKVSTKQAQELCESWNVPYIETSAKTRTRIDEAFEKLVRIVLKQKAPEEDRKDPKKKKCIIL